MGERKLFGTDGIRGKGNFYPMTCEIAMALGRAVTYHFKKSKRNKRPLIIVGKDTRLSCYMFEQAFSAGVCSQGGKVILTGPLPTPGVAFVAGSMRADAGVVISASHNSFEDNGIKLFDGKGYKLPDEVELELEKMVLNPDLVPVVHGSDLGSVKRIDEVFGRYIVHVKSAFSEAYDLENMRIVLDCANGAGYKIAPMVFAELGAEVITLGASPDGTNINMNCGSLHPEKSQEAVGQYRADIGVCLDGDGDRVIIVDAEGSVVDGDKLIGVLAKLMLARGDIKEGDEVVGTIMTNLGLERYIKSLGLKFHRTKVGDRYIMAHMKKSGSNLGGENSGHIILREHSTTGDGILAALKVIECMKYCGKSIRELAEEIKLFPQVLKNVVVAKKTPIEEVPLIQEAVESASKELGSKGRVLLRYSGTEPKLRVMVEGEDRSLVNNICDQLVGVVTRELS